MQRKFCQAFHFTGALGANVTITFTVPSNCKLVHVSAVASNDSDATLIVGDNGDTDEYLQAAVIGDSSVPVEFDGSDFRDTDGNQQTEHYPPIADGTIVVVTLDFDGAGGTPAEDVTIVLTFLEG